MGLSTIKKEKGEMSEIELSYLRRKSQCCYGKISKIIYFNKRGRGKFYPQDVKIIIGIFFKKF